MAKRGRRTTTEAERELWRTVTRDVVPLPTTPAIPAPPPAPLAVAEPVAKKPVAKEPPVKIDPAKLSPTLRAPAAPVAKAPGAGIDRSTEEKFRRGKMTIAGRLDLHGMTQAEAHGALIGFIEASFRAGRRCVLVITGKGPGAPSVGVLKRMVPRWLNTPPTSARILSTAAAQAKHGGDGAMYVLLRRRRET